jgi:beta-galactosidase
LDFQRFWSSELLSSYVEQRDAIRAHAPGIPVTTNFMLPDDPVLDLWEWGRAVDVVAIDHYPSSRGSGAYDQIALAGDLARSLNQGRPWVVMEQAASTTVEEHGTVHRPPGRTLLDALAYIAHGSDSALFFQWRAPRAGAEMYHSAMVPHAGADTRIFREMKILGQALEGMAEVCGSTLAAEVAIVFDFSSWWALEARRVLPAPVRYLDGVSADHRAVTRAGHLCDFVPPDGDLSRYKLVIVSSTYVLSDKAAQGMSQYVQDGGCMIVSYLSGVVGSSGTVGLGGYPAVLRSLLGVRVEEFHPLAPGEMVPLSGGGSGSLWSERLTTADADVVDRYETGDLADSPAITRRPAGKGCAWYVSTRLCDERNNLLVSDALAVAGVRPVAPKLGPAVHGLLRRDGPGRSWQFWLNYGGTSVQLPGDGYDLLSQRLIPAGQELRPGEAAVVRQDVSR